jgi:hypothetical protein
MKLTAALLRLSSIALFRQSSAFTPLQPSLTFGAPRLHVCARTTISALSVETTPDHDEFDVSLEVSESDNKALQNDGGGGSGSGKSLRVEMQTAASAEAPTQCSEETAEAVEKVLLRMVEEWNERPFHTINVPTSDDFYTVRKLKHFRVIQRCFCQSTISRTQTVVNSLYRPLLLGQTVGVQTL